MMLSSNKNIVFVENEGFERSACRRLERCDVEHGAF